MATRKLLSGLIQASNPINDESKSVAEIQAAMLEKHLPMIDDAGKKGVQILCLQEIFNGPYFCPGQDKRWYDAAEPVPGPTVEKLRPLRAEVQDGDGRAGLRARDGRRLLQHRRGHRRRRHVPRQVPQEPHPADERVLGEVLLPPGQPRLSDVPDPVREDRRVHLLRPPLPRGRARARPATARRSSTTRRRRSPGCRSTCGSSSSPRTPSRTATSSARSTASGRRRRGTSASSTATRTSSIRAGRSSRARRRTRTSWSSPSSTCR